MRRSNRCCGHQNIPYFRLPCALFLKERKEDDFCPSALQRLDSDWPLTISTWNLGKLIDLGSNLKELRTKNLSTEYTLKVASHGQANLNICYVHVQYELRQFKCSGWHITLSKTSSWLQNKSSALVWPGQASPKQNFSYKVNWRF